MISARLTYWSLEWGLILYYSMSIWDGKFRCYDNSQGRQTIECGSYIKYVKQMLRLKLIFDEVMGAQVGSVLALMI